ncbi:MAG: peptidoglycan-binding protein [Candidatus Paceibacterota bacterium]|jgi:photosystem II stability/assembly factor-like uncharacterized protein
MKIKILILAFVLFFVGTFTAQATYTFDLQFGVPGSGQGQFNDPYDSAIDSHGFIYVVDAGNGRIQKFDQSGNFVLSFGGIGTADGQFTYPNAIAIDSTDHVYISDYNAHRVQKFSSDGVFIMKWGENGTGNGQFYFPTDLALDSSGNFFVVDRGNDRVQKFDSSGNFVSQFSTNGDQLSSYPDRMVIDSQDNIYITDDSIYNIVIKKFDKDGNFIANIGTEGGTVSDGVFADAYTRDLALDASGDLIVTDYGNNRIQRITTDGVYVDKFGGYNTWVREPTSVTVNGDGHVFVTSKYHDRVIKYEYTLGIRSYDPNDGRRVYAWDPDIRWGASVSCSYSWDGEVWIDVVCSNSGSDILEPDNEGEITIYLKGVDSADRENIVTSEFVYWNDPVVTIENPIADSTITVEDWDPQFTTEYSNACYYSWEPMQSMSGGYWLDGAISSDGTKMVISGDPYFYTSSDSGQTWIQRTNAGEGQWESVAMSADGQRIMAVDWSDDVLKISTDGGETWANGAVEDARGYAYLASSADGLKVAATGHDGYIYTSTDGGFTWLERTNAGDRSWWQITSSADGSKLAAVDQGVNGEYGYIYTSSDAGVTWTQQTGSGVANWWAIDMSSDGSKLVASSVGENGSVFTSTDGGVTWTQHGSIGFADWEGATISDDGQKIAVSVLTGYIYITTDGGNSWTQRENTFKGWWLSLDYTPDGSKLLAVDNGNYLSDGYAHISTNDGATWTRPFLSRGTIFSCDNASAVSEPPQQGRNTLYIAGVNEFGPGEVSSVAFYYGTPPEVSISLPHSGGVVNHSQWNQLSYTHTNANACYYSWSPSVNTEYVAPDDYGFWSVASSYDGSNILAVDNVGKIYKSTDKGSTWNSLNNPGQFLNSGAISFFNNDTGIIFGNAPDIYISSDGGTTWNDNPDMSGPNWIFVAGAASTTKLVAVDESNDGYIHISPDGGVTWNEMTDVGQDSWASAAISADGMKILAASDYGQIAISNDGGTTWATSTITGGEDFYISASMSADGSVMVLGDYNYDGSLYLSTDGGITWVPQFATDGGIQSASVSADGRKIIAAEYEGTIRISTDGGATWNIQDTLGSQVWGGVVYFPDGTGYVAVADAVHVISDANKPLTPCGSTDGITLPQVGENTLYITGTNGIATVVASTTFTYDPDGGEEIINLAVITGTTTNTTSDATILNATLTGSATERGFYYGLTTDYTNVSTSTGSFGTGDFSLQLSSLTCGTTYHYKAFAYGEGTLAVGSDNSFSTLDCDDSNPDPDPDPDPEEAGGSRGGSRQSGSLICSFEFIQNCKVDALMKMIADVEAQIAALTKSQPANTTKLSFTRNLQLHASGSDVKALQVFLNTHGFPVATTGIGSLGNETTYFGPATYSALKRYQASKGIPSSGYFGPMTRGVVNK